MGFEVFQEAVRRAARGELPRPLWRSGQLLGTLLRPFVTDPNVEWHPTLACRKYARLYAEALCCALDAGETGALWKVPAACVRRARRCVLPLVEGIAAFEHDLLAMEEPKRFADGVCDFVRRLEQLGPGESYAFRGGWRVSGDFAKNRFGCVYHVLTRGLLLLRNEKGDEEEEEEWSLATVNLGQGADYHAGSSARYPLLQVRAVMVFGGISRERVLDPAPWFVLFQNVCTSAKSNGPETLYEIVLPHLASDGGRSLLDALEESEEYGDLETIAHSPTKPEDPKPEPAHSFYATLEALGEYLLGRAQLEPPSARPGRVVKQTTSSSDDALARVRVRFSHAPDDLEDVPLSRLRAQSQQTTPLSSTPEQHLRPNPTASTTETTVTTTTTRALYDRGDRVVVVANAHCAVGSDASSVSAVRIEGRGAMSRSQRRQLAFEMRRAIVAQLVSQLETLVAAPCRAVAEQRAALCCALSKSPVDLEAAAVASDRVAALRRAQDAVGFGESERATCILALEQFALALVKQHRAYGGFKDDEAFLVVDCTDAAADTRDDLEQPPGASSPAVFPLALPPTALGSRCSALVELFARETRRRRTAASVAGNDASQPPTPTPPQKDVKLVTRSGTVVEPRETSVAALLELCGDARPALVAAIVAESSLAAAHDALELAADACEVSRISSSTALANTPPSRFDRFVVLKTEIEQLKKAVEQLPTCDEHGVGVDEDSLVHGQDLDHGPSPPPSPLPPSRDDSRRDGEGDLEDEEDEARAVPTILPLKAEMLTVALPFDGFELIADESETTHLIGGSPANAPRRVTPRPPTFPNAFWETFEMKGVSTDRKICRALDVECSSDRNRNRRHLNKLNLPGLSSEPLREIHCRQILCVCTVGPDVMAIDELYVDLSPPLRIESARELRRRGGI